MLLSVEQAFVGVGTKYELSLKRLRRRLSKQWPKKTADISLRYNWFPREMTSEKRAQKIPY